MGILEKISEIEREISRTQKNKGKFWLTNICLMSLYNLSSVATEYHLGVLKAKLAKHRAQLLEPSSKSKEKGEGFEVLESGDARVALIGFPSVGKVCIQSMHI